MLNLPDDMKAIKAYAPEDYKLETVSRPKAQGNEVIIKVDACGICGSDIKAYHGAEYHWGAPGEDDPFLKPPVIPGHEFFGTVVELGEEAEKNRDVEIGDRITTDQIIPCGKCYFCETGDYWMCQVHNIYGFQNQVAEGAFAQYMRIYENSKIYKIPDSISLESAALIEPMAVAAHAVERGDITFDDFVVVAGAGTIGLSLVQLLKLKTPKKLVVLDVKEKRLELADELGADIILNPAQTNVEEKIKDMTDGYGCDVYFEATGSPEGVKQGLNMTRKLARFIEMSVFGEKTEVDWSVIGDQKELDIRGSHLGPFKYGTVIDLLDRGKLTSEGYISAKYSLDNFFEALDKAQEEGIIKVLITPEK